MPSAHVIAKAYIDSKRFVKANHIEDSWEWIVHANINLRQLTDFFYRDPRADFKEERKVKIHQ